jgi:glycosyltransferase involved in cell wall biosynthesis
MPSMHLLVLSQSYPKNATKYAPFFIHIRLLAYVAAGVDVDVVSFNTSHQYSYQGIRVYPAGEFANLLRQKQPKAIIAHAPNLRNHLRLLLLHWRSLPKLYFVFHGHEILMKSRYYPKPYFFQRSAFYNVTKAINNMYDLIKCKVLKCFMLKNLGKNLKVIFVSEYLKTLFCENVMQSKALIEKNSIVIHNAINDCFLTNEYSRAKVLLGDFITIRNYDQPVYALDLILKIALANPHMVFHIYGEGKFFDFVAKPKNVEVFHGYLKPAKIVKLLNQYKAALMPSYHDTQGVMACEMAAFGMPVIASNIPAAREMFASEDNVYLLDNDAEDLDLAKIINNLKVTNKSQLKAKLTSSKLAKQEIDFFGGDGKISL